MSDQEVLAWASSLWTPEAYADDVMERAQLKHSRRKHLRPHLVEAFRRALNQPR